MRALTGVFLFTVLLGCNAQASEAIDLTGSWDFRIEQKVAAADSASITDARAPEAAGWHTDTATEGWSKQLLPRPWEQVNEIGDIDGAVWFRRSIELTTDQAEQDWVLELGPIDDFDITWINGTEVGRTGLETPEFWKHLRRYPVSASLLRPGSNEVVVRVFDHKSGGGLIGKPEQLRLSNASANSNETIALAGTWTFRVELALMPQGDPQPDPGIAAFATSWPSEAPGDWPSISLPMQFEKHEGDDCSGICWYRRTISMPVDAGETWLLRLGEVRGALAAWWNGEELQRDEHGSWPLSPEQLTAGDHLLTLRLIDREPGRAGIMSDRGGFLLAPSSDVQLRIERRPYLQSLSPTGVTVCWRTALPSIASVTCNGRTFTESTATTDHRIRITDLSPYTIYSYTIPGIDSEFTFRTAPVPGSEQSFRTWILGDSGTKNQHARNVYQAYLAFTGEQYTDLWLMLGDNAYNDGTDEQYQQAVFEMYPDLLPVTGLFPAIGNHDAITADSADESGPYYDIFELPKQGECGGVASGTEAYYSFDYANVHFICLDSQESDRKVDGSMYRWLVSDLEQNTQQWLIAYWHHPPYSKGSHDSDRERQLIEMRENFLPLLEQHGVDIVFCGHSHSYERSILLDGHYGTSDSYSPSVHARNAGDGNPKGDGTYAKASGANNGAVYFTAGASGGVQEKGTLDHPVMIRSMYRLGSIVMDISGMRCELRYLDHKGRVADHLVIEKHLP